MNFPPGLLTAYGLTEEEVLEAMEEEMGLDQFANDERRVEFTTVPIHEVDGGAAYIASDMRLVAVVKGATELLTNAIFMRAAPSASENEEVKFQNAIQRLLSGKAQAEIQQAEEDFDEEPDNVLELFRAVADTEDEDDE